MRIDTDEGGAENLGEHGYFWFKNARLVNYRNPV
jgi:hypothetical protein